MTRITSRTVAAMAALSMGLGAAAAGDVVREGGGDRREALDAMENEEFPAGAWGALTDWSVEQPPTPAEMRGRVVLVVTWSSWYPRAQRVLPMVQSLYEQRRGEGLMVVGVHHERGFAGAERIARSRGVTFPYAHDATGSFRERLRVDQDPDFYVIDRAGQLRYADITTGSVGEAVETLLAETRSEAASLGERLAAIEAERDRQFRQSSSINQRVDLRSIPEVSFTPAPPAAYFNAGWPDPPPDEPGSDDPRWEEGQLGTLSLPTSPELWAGDPPKLAGRIRVVYFWHPDQPATLWEDAMTEMERVQTRHGRDVAVIGALFGPGDMNRRGRRDENQESEAERLQRWRRFFNALVERKQFRHHMLFEPSGGVQGPVLQEGELGDFVVEVRDGDLDPIAVLASTDGQVRWIGMAGEPSFYASLTQLLRVDPGVQRRRQAEREYIRQRSGE